MTYLLPNQRPRPRHVIGIDPDKNESGMAVWDNQQNKFVYYKAIFFYQLQENCLSFDKEQCVFYVEAGWENKGMNRKKFKNLPQGFELWSRERREAYFFQRGTDVGINFGAGWAITHVLRAHGHTVHHYCPKIAKWDAEDLRRYTGITDPTNSEVRDAIRAAFMNK